MRLINVKNLQGIFLDISYQKKAKVFKKMFTGTYYISTATCQAQ